MNFLYLKKGDKVVISQSSEYSPYLIATVLEVGAAKIKTNKGDFSTKSGKKWGYSGWYGDRLDDMTIEEAQSRNVEIEKRRRKRILANKLNNFNFHNCDIEVLEKVAKLVGIVDDFMNVEE